MFAERSHDCNAHECVLIAAVTITLSVEGRPVFAGPGQTVAAALTAAGIRVCRVTESGEGRGVFCGMGICQECVMTIDGERRGRA